MLDSAQKGVPFDAVFASEIESINKRRAELRRLKMSSRDDIALEPETDASNKPLVTSDGSTPKRPTDTSDVVGLALSGGGVRSASFCLGVLQALYKCGLIRKVDYLSTVSGGGYIGTSMTAGMSSNGGHFPFASYLSEDETPSLQHVRDYSNYLFPSGVTDVLSNLAVYVRGLIANIILVLPFLLAAALITRRLHPVPAETGLTEHFMGTGRFALGLTAILILWALARSTRWLAKGSEAPGYWSGSVGFLIVLLAFVFFCQLQPFILDAMFAKDQPTPTKSLVAVVQTVIVALAPVAAIVAFAAHKFGETIKSALESERIRNQIIGYAAKASVYVAGAIIPLLLWVIYLNLSYWLMCGAKGCAASPMPGWLWSTADMLVGHLPSRLRDWLVAQTDVPQGKRAVVFLYMTVFAACFLLMLLLRPNANSLHRLYRDRLSKAFMFKPQLTVARDADGMQPSLDPLDMKLSQLSEESAPYHLINTALNVQSSKESNRRGRNADFFLLSRNYVGSRTTRYVETTRMEASVRGFDLGSAMAVSGAAVSSNMGAASIKPLTATLALLNIRLGYWLKNPKRVNGASWNRFANFYFIAEMFGRLNEKRKSVYLTDGGHIDNIGLYELLRRRCKVIIVVDAEADPQMAFGAFNIVERYALIDLGVRIDLPWQQISNVAKATGAKIDKEGDAPKEPGPHVAVGEICYPGGRKGALVYIKSSLTGDENDYIFHYKKRYGSFPHETTLDQLFTEEQFEAYRALGFHAAYRFFDRRDCFAYPDPAANPCFSNELATLDRLFPVYAATDPCAPRPYETFVDRLQAEMKKTAADKARLAAAETCCADLAKAADRIAAAAQEVAGTLGSGAGAA